MADPKKALEELKRKYTPSLTKNETNSTQGNKGTQTSQSAALPSGQRDPKAALENLKNKYISKTTTSTQTRSYYSAADMNKNREYLYSDITDVESSFLEKQKKVENAVAELERLTAQVKANPSNTNLRNQYNTAYDSYTKLWEEFQPIQEAYSKAVDAYNGEYNNWRSTIRDSSEIDKELAALDERAKATKKNLYVYTTAQNDEDTPEIVGQKVNELRAELDAIEKQRALLMEEKQYGEHFSYADLMEGADFEEYAAKGAALENPENLGSKPGQKVQNVVTYFQDNPTEYYDKYSYMTEDEVAIYNYLLAKEGWDAANEFLSHMDEYLNARKGQELGENVRSIDNGAWRAINTGLYGLQAGVDQFAGGVAQFFSKDDLPTSAIQYGSQYIQEDLADTKVAKHLYNAATTVGNMAPSILLSTVTGGLAGAAGASAAVAGTVGKVVGAATMGTSAAGNAYGMALEQGYNQTQARTYSTLVGASEGLLQYALGGIGKLGGVADDALLAKVAAVDNAFARVALTGAVRIGSEITEEELQNFIEPMLASIIFNENYDAPTIEELVETAIVTALSTGVLEGGSSFSAGSNKLNGMDIDTAKAIIEEGLAADPNSSSYKLAQALQKQMESGKTVNDFQINALYGQNVENVDMESDPDAALAEAAREAVAKEMGVEATEMAQDDVGAENAPGVTESAKNAPTTAREAMSAAAMASVPYNVLNNVQKAETRSADPGYGEVGTKTFMEIVESGTQSAAEVRSQFQTAYELGKLETPREKIKLSGVVQESAYNAGRQDAILSMKKAMTRGATIWGKEGGLIQNEYSAKLDNLTADTLHKFGKATGTKIVIDAQVAGGDANGSYRDAEGTIHIAADATNPIMVVAKHEMTHRMQNLAPNEYTQYRNYAVQVMSEARWGVYGSNTAVEAKQEEYYRLSKGRVNLTAEQAMDEIAADFTEYILTDEKALNDFVSHVTKSAEHRTMGEKFFQAVREFIDKVKRIFKGDKTKMDEASREEYGVTIEQLEKAEQLWKEAYKATESRARAESGEVTKKRDGKLFRTTEADGTEVLTTANDNPVAMMDENGGAVFSLKTYDAFGRAELKRWLDLRVKKNQITAEDAADIVRQLDEYYDLCQNFLNKYAPFGAWSNAEVVRDNQGKPVFSVVKANGEYAMNLDFSLVCKKRRTLDAVFGEMIRRGMMDNVDLAEADIAKINDVIRESGFETACALCFVDAKRYRQAKVADAFVNQYNELVMKLLPEGGDVKAHYFDFVETGHYKNKGTGLHTLSNAELKAGIEKLKQVMRENGSKTVPYKIAKHLLDNPQDRKLVNRGEFMNTDGFGAVRLKNPRVLSLYNSSKGSGGPKAAFSDVQYLGDILKKNNFTPGRAYAVGGVRIQSFSDYIPRLVFDYLQMVGDLAAKQLPAHAYTKEAIFVKQFGMTGIKMNMSLVPAVAPDGVAAGLDKDGNYYWFDGQSFGSDVGVTGSGQTGFELAIQIQNAPGYSEHCGTIAVGVSDAHIWKMLDDENIRMIIPYHKSSLNHIVAVMNNIDKYTDYTSVQNTRFKDTGKKIDKKDFNFNEALRRTGDAKTAANEYLAWCEKNGYIPKFDTFAGHENYYKVLEDFSTYDNGVAAPQGPVTMTFPKEGDAFGSMAELIEQGLDEDAVLEGRRDKSLSSIVDKVEGVLKKRDDVQFSLKGHTSDGIEVYETSQEVKNLSWADRKSLFMDLMTREYLGRTAKFIRNGHAYYAKFSRVDVRKNIYGDNLSDDAGRDAKINAGASGDIFDLVENATYSGSKPEQGKDASAHKGVSYWDYFVKKVQIDNNVFDLLANVRKKQSGEYVYSLQLNEDKKTKAAPPENLRRTGGFNGAQAASTERVAQQEDVVNSESVEFSDRDIQYSLREKEPPKKVGIAYKVFYAKDGQLYPPMVANPGGAGTPVGVWLDADVAASAAPSKTGRPQVQAGGKGTNAGKMSLAFRPGWHLGDLPMAAQFARKNPETGVKDLFPADFVWAECEYAMDHDYQEEAMSYGYTENGKFRHSYAGLPRLPEDGYYRYRTNPNPDTVPWVITGAMRVKRILTDAETDKILRDAGVEPMKRQGGKLNLEKLGLTAGEQFGKNEQFSLKIDTDGLPGDVEQEAKNVVNGLKRNRIMSRHGTHKYASYTDKRIETELRESMVNGIEDYAHSYIAWVDPLDFLYATTTSAKGRDRIRNEAGGLRLDDLRANEEPIYLIVNEKTGEVVGHEGRHRMTALMDAGIDRVAVIIRVTDRQMLIGVHSDKYNGKLLWPRQAWRVKGQQFDTARGLDFTLRNLLPLSERYADAARQLFSQVEGGEQFSLKEQNDLMRDNAKLKEVNAALKAQFQTTKFAKVDPKELRNFTRKLVKDYDSEVDVDEVQSSLDELYTYLANGEDGYSPVWETAYRKAYDIAKDIVESASVTDDTMWQEYEGVRKYLRSTGISLNPEYENDLQGYENLNDFRKRNFGRIKIVKKGLDINTAYTELASMYPGLFSDEAVSHPADQLTHLAEVLDSMEPTEVNPFGYEIREASTWLANDIMERFFELPQAKPTFADKAERKLTEQVIKDAKKLEAVRAQNKEKVNKILTEYREKVKETRQKEKAAKWEAVKKVNEHYKAKEKKMSESRQAAALRARIERHAKELSKKLLRPTDKKHIPQELQGAVAKLLESINRESGYEIAFGTDAMYHRVEPGTVLGAETTKRTQAFAELQSIYAQFANDLTIDPDLLGDDGLLNDVIKMADKPLAKMTSSELQIVWNTLRAIEASIRTANKTHNATRWYTVEEAAIALLEDNADKRDKVELRGVLGKGQNLVGLDMETPETYFHMLGNAGDNIFRMMRSAQDQHIRLMKEAADFTHDTLGKVDVRKLESEMHEVTLGGEKVKLATAQIMELYVLMKRQQALDHIFVGGILPDVVSAKGLKKITKSKPVRGITLGDVSEAVNKLTEDQRKLAEKLQNYASTTLSKWGNKASMEVYGYEKFGEKNYWPIRVNRQEVKSDIQKDTAVTSLANRSFTKGVKPHANNSLRLGSIFDTFATHSSEMATYAAWLGTLEDVNRIRNYTFKDDNSGHTVDTVKSIINTVHGTSGNAYLDKLLADVTNGVKGTHGETKYMSGIMGNFKAAAVGANLRVIIQQPTAMLRAIDMIGAQYMAIPGNPLKGWEKAKKYAPIAQWKDWGYFDINTGRQMKDVLFDSDTVVDKAKSLSMWGAGAMDSLAWGQLWNAVEAETKAKNKELKPDTEAFYKAVAERFTEIVDHTQVVDGILQRSQIMRNADGITKMATSFMGEPTKQYNMMMQAAYDVKKTSGKNRKTAMKQLGRTAATLSVAGIANAMMQTIIDAVRDDDKEKEYWEKWLEAFKKNAVSTFNPISYIPFAKDIISILQGYDVTRMDMESIEKLVSAGQNMIKALKGEGKYTVQAAAINLIAEVARLYGIPVSNLKREISTFAKSGAIWTDNYLMQYRMEKWDLSMNNSLNRSTFTNILYNAYKNDKDAFDIIYADMLKEDKFKSVNADGEVTTTADYIASALKSKVMGDLFALYKSDQAAYKEMYSDLISRDFLKKGDKSTADIINSAMESLMKKDQGVSDVDDLDQRYYSPADQRRYDEVMSTVQKSGLWSAATEKQRDNLRSDVHDYLTGESKAAQEMVEDMNDAKNYGIDETEYLLWNLALEMYDMPSDSGNYGSYNTREKADAIAAMTSLSDKEKAYLWSTKTTSDEVWDAYDAGVDISDYVDFKAALSELEAGVDYKKGDTKSRKNAIADILNSMGLTEDEWYWLYHTEYKK